MAASLCRGQVTPSSPTDLLRLVATQLLSAQSARALPGGKLRPPLWFNCRTVLIPITKLDGWDGEESDEPTVWPPEGFN